MLAGYPLWFQIINGAALVIGYVVLAVLLLVILKPMLRGWSYGLYNFVLYCKVGAPFLTALKMFVRALFVYPFKGFTLTTTTHISSDGGSWYGIFGWHYKKSLHRGLWKQWTDEIEAAKNKPDEPETEESELDDFK